MDMIKYVMIDNCFPVIFQGKFEHAQMQNLGKITSAGFISKDQSSCYGFSKSLGIGSNEDDITIINLFLGKGVKRSILNSIRAKK